MVSATDKISVADSYRAMFAFLDAYWDHGGKTSDEIASLLSSMQFGEDLGPQKTMDPAQWHDWIDAVEKIV